VIDGALERSIAYARDDKVSVLNGYDDICSRRSPKKKRYAEIVFVVSDLTSYVLIECLIELNGTQFVLRTAAQTPATLSR
jgi:hypothetical protein